jgi:hypothetical protein
MSTQKGVDVSEWVRSDQVCHHIDAFKRIPTESLAAWARAGKVERRPRKHGRFNWEYNLDSIRAYMDEHYE